MGCDAGRAHVIHYVVYRCLPRHPLRNVPMLANTIHLIVTGARHVVLYMFQPSSLDLSGIL